MSQLFEYGNLVRKFERELLLFSEVQKEICNNIPFDEIYKNYSEILIKECLECGKKVRFFDNYKYYYIIEIFLLFCSTNQICNECERGIDYIENKECYKSYVDYMKNTLYEKHIF